MSKMNKNVKKQVKQMVAKDVQNELKSGNLGGAVSQAAKARIGKKSANSIRNQMQSSNMTLVEQIAASFAMPELRTVVRYPSSFSQALTAVAAPYTVQTAAWNTGSTNQSVSANDMACFVTRSPEAAVVVYDANTSASSWAYQFSGTSLVSGVPVIPAQTFTVNCLPQGKSYIPTIYGTALNAYAPHGGTMYAGFLPEASPGKWFWMNGGDSLTVTGNMQTNVTTFNCSLHLDSWNPATGFQPSAAYTASTAFPYNTNTTLTLSVPADGYYCMAFVTEQTIGAAVPIPFTFSSVKLSGSGDNWCHLALPYYSNNLASAEGVRVLSVSARYTNEAAEIYRQGKIAALQVPETNHWYDYVQPNSGGFTAISQALGAETLPLDKGLYIFLKPTKPDDFDYRSNLEVENGSIVDSRWPIDQRTSFLAIYAVCTTAQGRDGYFTFSFGVEYLTTDVWREINTPSIEPKIYEEAIRLVGTLKQIHENPLHISDIWNGIKSFAASVASGITKYGPGAIKLAGMVLPALV